MSGGFRRLAHREIARHWLYSFRISEVEGPDGGRFERAWVDVPGAVGVVALDEGSDEVVLVRQYRTPLDRDLLELPAGMCDVDGEDPLETGRRELREEAGFEASSFERLCGFHNAAGMSNHYTHVYLATGLTACAIERQGPEEAGMTVERVRLADVPQLVASGVVVDAKTVIGLLMVHARVHGGARS